MADGSIWDEILDTRHVQVLRTYIERWPRKGREPEKVLIVVVEPDDEARSRCPALREQRRSGRIRRAPVADAGRAREEVLPGVPAAEDRVRGAREDHRESSVGTPR